MTDKDSYETEPRQDMEVWDSVKATHTNVDARPRHKNMTQDIWRQDACLKTSITEHFWYPESKKTVESAVENKTVILVHVILSIRILQ